MITSEVVAARSSRRKGAAPALATSDEIAERVTSDLLLGFGGTLRTNSPAGFARALLRADVKGLRLFSMPSSYTVDLLLAAGAVSELHTMFVSFEELGLAPGYRRAAESGSVSVRELDGPVLFAALRAAACDLPWFPVRVTGNDIARVNPEAFADRELGDPLIQPVLPLAPDLTVLQAAYADMHGNAYHVGTPTADFLLATASRHVVVVVEEVVPRARAGDQPTIPSYLIDEIVAEPMAGHPLAVPGYYVEDEAAIKFYLDSIREGNFEEFQRMWVDPTPRAYAQSIDTNGVSDNG